MNENRIGEQSYNTQGCLMQIIEYNSSRDVLVEFQDKYHYRKRTIYGNFKSGRVENRYYPTIQGVGMLGIRKTWDDINHKKNREYTTWTEMLRRCYSHNENERLKFSAYNDCSVDQEWHLFDNYYDWVQTQTNHMIDDWTLDKDIKIKHNRIYSCDTCYLVPIQINMLFERQPSIRGDLPIGVQYKPKNSLRPYMAMCRQGAENIYLGSFANEYDAFYAYKQFKEKHIKNVAEKEFELGNITEECYKSLMTYSVDYDD